MSELKRHLVRDHYWGLTIKDRKNLNFLSPHIENSIEDGKFVAIVKKVLGSPDEIYYGSGDTEEEAVRNIKIAIENKFGPIERFHGYGFTCCKFNQNGESLDIAPGIPHYRYQEGYLPDFFRLKGNSHV